MITLIGLFCAALSGLLLLAALLPFVPLPHGFIRTLEFPRSQFAVLGGLCAAGALATLRLPWPGLAVAAIALIAAGIECFFILRFTPVWPKQVKTAPASGGWSIKILVSNVKQSNRAFERTVRRIRETDPDLVLLMETDQAWVDAMREPLSGYAHRTELAQSNGYGMIFAGRSEPLSCEVKHLLNDEVPSIHLTLEGPRGSKPVRVIMIHPEPPVPADDTYGRDAEIGRVAQIARADDSPIIVTGDLNDVAWSHTTRRFLRVSKLLDPRQGRGLYNTFDARYPIFRWPLDHIFHSSHFSVRRLERLKDTGSDHFPIFFELVLTEPDAIDRDEADRNDLEEVGEAVETERQRDSRPHGADWET